MIIDTWTYNVKFVEYVNYTVKHEGWSQSVKKYTGLRGNWMILIVIELTVYFNFP